MSGGVYALKFIPNEVYQTQNNPSVIPNMVSEDYSFGKPFAYMRRIAKARCGVKWPVN